jgi:hypothetical protein
MHAGFHATNDNEIRVNWIKYMNHINRLAALSRNTHACTCTLDI